MPDLTIGRLKYASDPRGFTFTVAWHQDGKRRRYRLKALDKKDAEREAIDVYRRETVKTADTTIESLWEAYRKEKEGRRVAEAMRHEWKALGPFFGHLRPDMVGVEQCRAYTVHRRQQGKQDGTIWTELGHLRTVFIWSQQRRLIDHAPHVERPAKPAPKDRWLTEAELVAFLQAPAAFHITLACELMYATAGRVTAILELTWDRVDLENGTINLKADAKGPRKGRAAVPINDDVKAMLQTAKGLALTDYVIEWAGKPVKSIKKGFGLKAAASGVEGVTPHVLRHTAAVHMAKAGRPMERISQYLGHSSTAITERVYARFAPDHLREEAAVLDLSKYRKKAV